MTLGWSLTFVGGIVVAWLASAAFIEGALARTARLILLGTFVGTLGVGVAFAVMVISLRGLGI